MWWKLDSASGQARSVLSPEEAVVFLLWFCDLWSTKVSWLDKIGWLPKTVPAFEAWGNWVTLILYGAWKVSVWNTTRSLEWGLCVNGGFCVFGKRISVLGILLFVMISVVSEQNFSEPTTSYLSTGACKWISCLQSRLKYPKVLPGRNLSVAVLITFAFTWLLVALLIALPFD